MCSCAGMLTVVVMQQTHANCYVISSTLLWIIGVKMESALWKDLAAFLRYPKSLVSVSEI